MKQFESFSNMCYSSRLKMKSKIKYISISIASAVGAAVLILGTTLIVSNLHTENGKGGLETPGLPEVTESALDEVSAVQADAAPVAEVVEYEPETKALPLTYTAYRVKQGDMIGKIAEKFNITEDTIISVNNIKQSRLIQIGQYLKIPSQPGILYSVKSGESLSSIAAKYKIDAKKVAESNNLELDSTLKVGQTLYLTDAKMDWITRQEINGDLFRKPLRCRYRISSPFGWRQSPFNAARRSYHGGIDMACGTGNSIYAAMAGKVTTAGWSNVYGNYVIVTHHSGYKTLYGHMSQILVTKGQNVTTETRLGRVGSTGQSTGPHLHFTVYKNGKSVNPAKLWN